MGLAKDLEQVLAGFFLIRAKISAKVFRHFLMAPTKHSMRRNFTRLTSLAVLGLVLDAAVSTRATGMTLEIASLNYTIENGALKSVFGSPVTVAIVNSTIVLEAIVLEYTPGTKITDLTAVPTSPSVVLSHTSLAPTTAYIIYDGQRVWEATSGVAGDITLTNTELRSDLNLTCAKPPPSDIEDFDYLDLDYTAFAAVPGTLAANGLQAADVFVDLGTLMTGIALKDDGAGCSANGDPTVNDGMYHARIAVLRSDEWFVLNAVLTATVIDTTGSPTELVANSPFGSQRPISIDAVPPKITLLNSVPSVFYIAPAAPFDGLGNESQGTTTNNPNNERTELHFSLLDKSAAVTMIIEDSAGAPVFSFPIQTLDPGDHFFLWDGRDDAGVFQLRDKYSFVVEATDDVGNAAIAKTGQVQITGLFVQVKNLTMSPNPAPSDNGTGENFTITTISFDVEMTGASQLELKEFGLDTTIPDPNRRPHMLVKPHLFDAAGNLITIFGPDLFAGDGDSIFILNANSNVPDQCGLPQTYYGRDGVPVAVPLPGVGVYTVGDGDGNDWDTLMWNFFDTTTTGNTDDVYTGSFSFPWVGNLIVPGTYIMEVQAELAGEAIVAVGTPFDKPECFDPLIDHQTQKYHAFPVPKGIKSRKVQAFIFVEDDTTVTGDQTPPQVVAVNPADNAVVASGFVTDSNPVWVVVEDVDSGPSATKTFVELKGPDGAVVPGSVANDGGSGNSMKFYYLPASPVTVGGVYTINVIPVDQSNNVGAVSTFLFTVQDASVPVVSSVSVTSLGVPKIIYPSNPGTLPGVSEVTVVLLPPLGGASVDFASSSIVITDDQGNASAIYSGTMTVNTSTNSLVFVLDALLLTEGKHRVTVEAFSANGSSAIYTFDFTINTQNMLFVDYPPATGFDVTETCMYFRDSDVAVTDNGGTAIDESTITVADPGAAVISALGASGDLASGSVLFGQAAQFFESEMNFTTIAGQLPVIRIHFSAVDVTNLPAGLDITTGIEVYYHNGSEWKYAKNQTGVVLSGPFQDTSTGSTEYYFELSSVSKSYEYYGIFYSGQTIALLATPTATPGLTEPMQSTRAFSPDGVSPCGSPSTPSLTCARIFYMTLPAIANPTEITTNARIYNLRGDLVRILETQTDIDVAMNYDTNYDPTIRQYFLDWDGLNEQGILVKNGVYLVAVEWEWTNPMTFEVIRGTKSLPVAVVR